jgi:tripartite-type tricarboxylate transporter receptor subunit TctC
MASTIEHIRAGRLRPIAVTGATRASALPNVPAIAATLPGYDATGWNGIGAPRGTPAEVVQKLNAEINVGLADSRLRARIADFGDAPFASSPDEFGRHIAEFTDKWGKVIRAANIKLQ